jgi:hypothetical protein
MSGFVAIIGMILCAGLLVSYIYRLHINRSQTIYR